MSHNLNALKGVILGSIMGVTRGDTRSLDDNSHDFLLYHKQVQVTLAHDVLFIPYIVKV